MTLGIKYLVFRRDGSRPPWPLFVLGAADRAAPAALRSYATMCKSLDVKEEYVDDVLAHAKLMQSWHSDPRELMQNFDAADVTVIMRGLLADLSEEQRTDVFNYLRVSYCIDCGATAPCKEHPQ